MDWPYHFPHPADVIAADAERGRMLSVTDRLSRLSALVASGQSLVGAMGGTAHALLREQAEADWQAAHRRVLNQHEH